MSTPIDDAYAAGVAARVRTLEANDAVAVHIRLRGVVPAERRALVRRSVIDVIKGTRLNGAAVFVTDDFTPLDIEVIERPEGTGGT